MLIGLKKPSRRIEKAKAETSSGKDGARARSRPDWARLSQHASHRRPPGETLAPRRSRQRHGAMDRRATHRFHQGVSRHRRFSNAKCRDSVLTKYPDAVCSVRQSAMMSRVENNHRARAAGFAPPFCASFCASLQLQLRAPATLHYASTTSLLHFASTVTVPGERSNTRTFCLKIANFCKLLCNLKSFWNCASHTQRTFTNPACAFFAPPVLALLRLPKPYL